jgi:CheY-like chemotaxis protein
MSIALIADDDPSIRDFLCTLLRLEGHYMHVSAAADRDTAINLATQAHPRLILMDYNMPGLSADDFVARIRKEMPETWIVLMTSAHYAEEKAAELGLNHFIAKPFDVAALREMLRGIALKAREPAA